MGIFYKRNLPHFNPKDAIFFVTFRLAGSLPVNVIRQMQGEYLSAKKLIEGYDNSEVKILKHLELRESYFYKFDAAVHKLSNGPYFLKNEEIASIVYDALLFRDKNIYDLFAFTIMPNHVHMVFRPTCTSSRLTRGNLTITGMESLESGDSRYRGNLESGDSRYRGNLESGDSRYRYLISDIMNSLKKFTARKGNIVLNRKGNFWQYENYDHVIRSYGHLVRIVEYILNNPVSAGLIDSCEKWRWNYYNPELL